MSPAMFFTAVDPSLGRLDYDSLSDQACMEILTAGFTPLQKERVGLIRSALKKDCPYKDICEWVGAVCDEEGRVTKIRLKDYTDMSIDELIAKYSSQNTREKHRINLEYIPKSVTSFVIEGLACLGTCVMADLPRGLKVFDVRQAALDGTFDADQLPRCLVDCLMRFNNFQGSCDIELLPPDIERVSAGFNKLTGTLDLNRLPKKFRVLHLKGNALSGEIRMTSLPEKIELIDLSHNAFAGEFVLTDIPPTLYEFQVASNQLSGTAILAKDVNGNVCKVILASNDITDLRDEKGRRHRFSKRVLKNQLWRE